MHRVATKAITPDQATEEDDAIARHLARTLMGENPGFTSALPLVGPALVEELRKLPDYAEDELPEEIDSANPRAAMVYVCRTFLHGIYDMVRTLTKADEMTPEKLSETVNSTAALWTLRSTGRRPTNSTERSETGHGRLRIELQRRMLQGLQFQGGASAQSSERRGDGRDLREGRPQHDASRRSARRGHDERRGV